MASKWPGSKKSRTGAVSCREVSRVSKALRFQALRSMDCIHWTQSCRICREMRVDDGRECKIVHDRRFMETVDMLQLNVATKLFNSLIRHALQDIPEVQDPLCR